MTTGKEKRFQKVLELERERLTSEISRLSEADVVSDNLGYSNHMADDATEAFEQAKGVALRQHLVDKLTQVSDALERMKRGTYGICQSCGRSISPDRLEVVPHASLCVDCQQKREHAANVRTRF
jgi:RNA polymerase-binding protein DksA